MREWLMNGSHVFRCIAAAALAVPLVVSAQVYKWTDERGSVNYGNKPPPNARNVVKINEDSGKVSTVPSIPQEQIDAQRDRAQQQRVDRLERDLRNERSSAGTRSATPDANAYARWREQCLAERRVDCDDPSRGALTDPGYYYPGAIVRPPRPQPPFYVPPQPPQAWPNNPSGAVVPSPPLPPGPRVASPPKPEPR